MYFNLLGQNHSKSFKVYERAKLLTNHRKYKARKVKLVQLYQHYSD